MPIDPKTGLFGRLFRFTDRFARGAEISRADIDTALDDLASGLNSIAVNSYWYIGEFDASLGAFPAARPDGSVVQARDAWVVKTPGSVGGITFADHEILIAMRRAPGASYSGNWLRIPADVSPLIVSLLTQAQGLADAAEAGANAALLSESAAATSATLAQNALETFQVQAENLQPKDDTLTHLALIDDSVAGKMPFTSASGVWSMLTTTTLTRGLLGAVDSAAARETLGVGLFPPVATLITSWDTVDESGLYMGYALATGPDATNWYIGWHQKHNSIYAVQEVICFTYGNASNSMRYRRYKRSTWTAWVRCYDSAEEIKSDVLNAAGSAPAHACRAWVNFNGTGTVAIRAAGNVSSITDSGAGNYTANFNVAMPHANYAAVANYTKDDAAVGNSNDGQAACRAFLTTSVSIFVADGSGVATDAMRVSVAVFC